MDRGGLRVIQALRCLVSVGNQWIDHLISPKSESKYIGRVPTRVKLDMSLHVHSYDVSFDTLSLLHTQ